MEYARSSARVQAKDGMRNGDDGDVAEVEVTSLSDVSGIRSSGDCAGAFLLPQRRSE